MNFDFSDHTSEVRLSAGEALVIELSAGGHWYGHGFSHEQPYPLEKGTIENNCFAVNNIQSPVWMCSAGVLLFADTVKPLQITINCDEDGLLRICCPDEKLLVRIFRGENLPQAHAAWLRYVGWPNQPPPVSFFGDSFFCTWTQYPRCITQERIIDTAMQIRRNGYPCSKLMIDDRWENCFGELEFADQDFQDPRKMFAELRKLDFDAWLWITPFVNLEAANFASLEKEGILVPHRSGNGAAILKWWGGTAGLIDVTAPQGRAWFRKKLQALLDLGAAGFKIDGGDHKYLPADADCDWHTPPGASGYSDQLLAIFDEIAPNRCEARTAWLSQERSVLWREGGKDSHWGLNNGLKALVTLGMNLGLLGYDLLIPDMVPGRVQTMSAEDPLPNDELMLRWTEVSAFFPFLQFSYFPWNYAVETADAVLGFTHVHKTLEIYLAEQTVDRSAPLLRPVWYDFPKEEKFYTIADEFLLGRDLLVAPVLDEGVEQRDIQLPPGDWVDAWSGENCSGFLPQWAAPCPGIPVFVNSRNTRLLASLVDALKKINRGSVSSGICTAKWQAGINRDLNITG